MNVEQVSTDRPERPSPGRVLRIALALGVIHAIVDGASVTLLVQQMATPWVLDSRTPDVRWMLFALYTTMAFGPQFAIGAVADRLRRYQHTAQVGLGLILIAVLFFPSWPLPGIVLVGLGNAAFHVGAGAMALRLAPDRAAVAGLYVAPGNVGLTFGLTCGAWLPWWNTIFAGLLLGSMAFIWALDAEDQVNRQPLPTRLPLGATMAMAAVGALMLAVALRSSIGQTLVGTYRGTGTMITLGFMTAAVLGKAGGGFAADRFGWLRTAVVGLLVAAPLLVMSPDYVFFVILGAMLFQVTMPITLLAIYRVFPDEPGMAFGLPSFALMFGALPVYVFSSSRFSDTGPLLLMMVASAVILLLGLPPILRARERGTA